jgi:hypothetical protein
MRIAEARPAQSVDPKNREQLGVVGGGEMAAALFA